MERGTTIQPEEEEIDPRTLPQATIRKVIKERFDKGAFEVTPDINKNPLVCLVPWEIARNYRPKTRTTHQTIRYSTAQKPHETPELL